MSYKVKYCECYNSALTNKFMNYYLAGLRVSQQLSNNEIKKFEVYSTDETNYDNLNEIRNNY